MADPTVAIVVPAFNAEGTLGDTLSGLLSQRPSPPDRIVVVDDASRDGTRRVAEAFASRHPGRIEVVGRETNGGEAAALNDGFSRVKEDRIGIVEADVLVAPDWLARLTGCLDGSDAVGAGGALRPFPGDPWAARLAGYEVERRQSSQGALAGGELRHVSSANVLYRRRAWEAAGPFREDLVNASLDSDFNARLLAAGLHLAWDPEAVVWHHYKPTVAGFLARTLSYARTRWHVAHALLYPADRGQALLLITDLLALSSVFWGGSLPALAALAWLLALGGRAPLAWEILRERRDPAGLLLPPLLVLRGWVAALGLLLGLLEHPVAGPDGVLRA